MVAIWKLEQFRLAVDVGRDELQCTHVTEGGQRCTKKVRKEHARRLKGPALCATHGGALPDWKCYGCGTAIKKGRKWCTGCRHQKVRCAVCDNEFMADRTKRNRTYKYCSQGCSNKGRTKHIQVK